MHNHLTKAERDALNKIAFAYAKRKVMREKQKEEARRNVAKALFRQVMGEGKIIVRFNP
jgi:hypothetical protein